MAMGLLEAEARLKNMIYPYPRRGLSIRDVDAIKRALTEVEITIDNGDESN